MSLSNDILNIKPREESGSRTTRKYQFQKDLSLYLMIENHEKMDDYLFLFDFHDDLVITDSPSNPTLLDFFQIKSKDSGDWTVSLLNQSSSKMSILGKLYLNKLNFPDNTNSLNFISNGKFKFKTLKDKSNSLTKKCIHGNELDDKTVEKINIQLKQEHNLQYNPNFENITNFYVTKLSNEDSSTHCEGSLSVLVNRINPNNNLNIGLAYKQIIGEITRKTKNTVCDKTLNSIDELIEIKGITKDIFLDYLTKAGLYKSVHEEWDDVKNTLENCGIGHMELLLYRNGYRDVCTRLIKDSTSVILHDLQKEVVSSIEEETIKTPNFNGMNLLQIVNHCYPLIKSTLYEEYFIKSLIIKTINEK